MRVGVAGWRRGRFPDDRAVAQAIPLPFTGRVWNQHCCSWDLAWQPGTGAPPRRRKALVDPVEALIDHQASFDDRQSVGLSDIHRATVRRIFQLGAGRFARARPEMVGNSCS